MRAQSESKIGLYKRGRVYWARIVVGGQLYRRTTGTSNQREAYKVAEQIERQIRDELLKLASPTLFEVGYEFIHSRPRSLSDNTLRSYTRMLEAWSVFIGDIRALDLDESGINSYIQSRLSSGCANGTVIAEVSFLSSAFKRRKISPNPFDGLSYKRTIGEAEKRKTVLSRSDF